MTTQTRPSALQDYIAVSRYARFRPDLGRRETWDETVDRVRDMHMEFFRAGGTPLGGDIYQAFELVRRREVLPSMRSLQFGGAAILAKHGRIFNCSFSFADRPRFFAEAFYMLLCGTGVGFSVQRHHVEKLPVLQGPDPDKTPHTYPIQDTIEGWADALNFLVASHIHGWAPLEFDYSEIRPEGAPLVTAGGKAPGPAPLEKALEAIRGMLAEATGRQLRPIEVYDIVMHVSQAVLSGGVRRSATICLFSADDAEMASAKTGHWFTTHPQRAFSNNSAILPRATATRAQFDRLFAAQKEFGEPGFYFTESTEYGANPCVEIGLNPVYNGETGWQMCNLTTINGARVKDAGHFHSLCQAAAFIGTLQAAYTDIAYLGDVTRSINDREALLGVSICGILDRPDVLLDAATLRRGAELACDTNRRTADRLGINPAARVTCVKPEGTASLLLGAASGIHPHHARRYFRRVQNSVNDPVYQQFKATNPHMCQPSVYDQNGRTDVVTFPVEAPATARVRSQVDALTLLEHVRHVQQHWVRAGTGSDEFSPGLEHNVSNTITVRPEEWDQVREFIWANRQHFTGIALLQDMGDKAYAQAPREEAVTEEELREWQRLRDLERPVDFTKALETHDTTALAGEGACAGGKCELP